MFRDEFTKLGYEGPVTLIVPAHALKCVTFPVSILNDKLTNQ